MRVIDLYFASSDVFSTFLNNLFYLYRLDGAFSNCTPEEITQQMLKADFHGAVMEVHKSTCPNLVGINGIVVFETRNVIKLLGKDNITRSKFTCLEEILKSFKFLLKDHFSKDDGFPPLHYF